MKRKKLWITLLLVAVLAPSVILCALMMTSDDFALKDFASSSSLSVTDADGETTELQTGEEHFELLTRVLTLAQASDMKREGRLSSRLYQVKTADGDQVCYLGIEDGQTAVEWQENVYILSYPHLRCKETVIYPCLVRYGVKTESGYLDAPILSQRTDKVYAVKSMADFRSLSFDSLCNSSVEILLYAQGAQTPTQTFSAFDEVAFDEEKAWTVIVNAELVKDGYRVQCGYEFSYQH